MKFQLLSIITILLLIPIVTYATESYIVTDKYSYYYDDIVYVSGNVGEEYEEVPNISFTVYKPNGSPLLIRQTTLQSDGSFNFEFEINSRSWFILGVYTIHSNHGSETTETTFELLPDQIEISTDKTSYNEIESIQLTGQLNNIISQTGDEIKINVFDYQDMNIIPEEIIQFTNSTHFSHVIITRETPWMNYNDIVTIQADYLNYTAIAQIEYSSFPENLSLESLHILATNNNRVIEDHKEMLAEHDGIISEQVITLSTHNNTITEHETSLFQHNSTMASYESMMYDQQDEINSIHEDIEVIETAQWVLRGLWELAMELIEEIREEPIVIPTNAPIILSITADDPDNLDEIYSNDDTITILFDSNTNRPGGVDFQKKSQVNNMFTFTESLGTSYSGIWETADTFVVTINSARNSSPPLVGNTTVTPTEITIILSADGSSTPSNSISPVLVGDWGIISIN